MISACYFFSAVNFVYAGQGTYDDAGELPENSTATAPPTHEAYTVGLWNAEGESWSLIPDYRGSYLFDTATGEFIEIISGVNTSPGEDETILVPPDYPAQPCAYDFVGGEWVANVSRQNNVIAASMRVKRNALLKASDFYVSADCMINTTQLLAFAKYRQWLRDMPGQGGWPASPTYPTLPTYTKAVALDSWATKTTQINTGNAFAIANPIA